MKIEEIRRLRSDTILLFVIGVLVSALLMIAGSILNSQIYVIASIAEFVVICLITLSRGSILWSKYRELCRVIDTSVQERTMNKPDLDE